MGLPGLRLILVLICVLVNVYPAIASGSREEEDLGDSSRLLYEPIPTWDYLNDFNRLRASPSRGEAPLAVFFDFIYPDDSVLYWEATIEKIGVYGAFAYTATQFPDGFNYFEEWGFGYPYFTHTFDTPGSYRVYVVLYGHRAGSSTENISDTGFVPFVNQGDLDVVERDLAYVTVRGASDKTSPAPQLLSVYDYSWPEVELDVTVVGNGPWDVSYTVDCSIPVEYIKSVSWNLNDDGVFDVNTGRTLSRQRSLTLPGKYIVTVRVTDIRDYRAEATATFILSSHQG